MERWSLCCDEEGLGCTKGGLALYVCTAVGEGSYLITMACWLRYKTIGHRTCGNKT